MTRLFAATAILATWLAAFSIELLARGMYRVYFVFGADLPDATIFTFAAVRSYAPWLAAAAATVLIGGLALSKSPRLGRACAVVALVTALGASLAALSIALPHVKMCGSFLPDWEVAQSNQSVSGSCGR